MSLYQKVLASFNRLLWKDVDVDGKYANQCVDSVRQYALDIDSPILTYGNARWFATIGLWPNWERVQWEPWIWDIVVQPRWAHWHIAVFIGMYGSFIEVHEQNRNGNAYKNNNDKNRGSPVSIGRYKIQWDEVYFRPIPKPKKKTPAPNPIKNGKRIKSR